MSLQVDLLLSDAASTSEAYNLFNVCCHFAYGDAAMWLKCVRHPKNAIFTQNERDPREFINFFFSFFFS